MCLGVFRLEMFASSSGFRLLSVFACSSDLLGRLRLVCCPDSSLDGGAIGAELEGVGKVTFDLGAWTSCLSIVSVLGVLPRRELFAKFLID